MNAEDKRALLLDRLADHVLAEGLGGASLRPLARAVGTSDRMLLYYFPDKATLIAAVLARIAERFAPMLDGLAPATPGPPAALLALLPDLVAAPAFAPFMSLWLEMAALAARGDAGCRAAAGAIGRDLLGWIAARLDLPEPERGTVAARLFQQIEGAAVLRAIGLDDVVARAML
ncbi:MAG: hypothetical protein A4S12_03550 [Proteobacteria bacterium SG_bin5]|nr:MAG: hypothetical protein A4S12_03550 [Proteobacteria bacterium SG_bin5]